MLETNVSNTGLMIENKLLNLKTEEFVVNQY